MWGKRSKDSRPRHNGDVLGLSDASPSVEIPRATSDRGGHPRGIEVENRPRRHTDLEQSTGVTGIDMGAGGSGTDLESE